MITTFIFLIVAIIAFGFILWGLRLYKIYIIANGFLFGIIFGVIVGLLSKTSLVGSIVIGLVLGIICALLAWPVQKLLVCVTSGLFSGIIGFLLGILLTKNLSVGIGFALTFFIIGVVIAFYFHETFIILLMGIQGSFLIIYIYSYNWINTILFKGKFSDALEFLKENPPFILKIIIEFIFIISIYAILAYYFCEFWRSQ